MNTYPSSITLRTLSHPPQPSLCLFPWLSPNCWLATRIYGVTLYYHHITFQFYIQQSDNEYHITGMPCYFCFLSWKCLSMLTYMYPVFWTLHFYSHETFLGSVIDVMDLSNSFFLFPVSIKVLGTYLSVSIYFQSKIQVIIFNEGCPKIQLKKLWRDGS